MGTDALDRVARAADSLAESERERRASLVAARAEGHSLRALAAAAGLTPEGVRKILAASDVWRAKAERRLDELDGRWNALVDVLAEVERPPDAYIRRETAKRNGRRGKDARKGLRPRPTVAQETRTFAESKLLRALRDHPEDPSAVIVLAELAEAEAIRQALEAAYDRSLGIAD